MARKRIITTEELIKNLDEYIIENNGVVPTIPKFGDYLREKGIALEDYIIRRDKDFRVYYDKVDKKANLSSENELIVYHTLDIPAFIAKNNSAKKMTQALATRDQYYSNICNKAVNAINVKNKLEEKVKKLDKELLFVEDMLKEAEANCKTDEIIAMRKAIVAIKQTLNSYIYPDMANAVLKKEGLLEVVNSVIPDELANKMLIDVTGIAEEHEEELPEEFLKKPPRKLTKEHTKTDKNKPKTKEKSHIESTGIKSVDKLFGGFEDG